MTEESAASFLKAKGWSVNPPRFYPKPKNGCFRIKTNRGEYYMEGDITEEEEVRDSYSQKGHKVFSVQYHEDSFFDLE